MELVEGKNTTGWALMGIECVSAQSHSLISTSVQQRTAKLILLWKYQKAEGGIMNKWRRTRKHRNYFFKCQFLKMSVIMLSFSLSVFMYLHWFYPSLSSVSFDSWCFLEELRSQECWLRGLKLKERFCSPYYGKRQAQYLFNRKSSTWDGEEKWRKWMYAHIVEVHHFKITWSHS